MRLININKKYKTDIMPSKKPSKKSKTEKTKVEKKVEEPKVVEKPVPDAVPIKVEEPANILMEYEAEITKLQTDLKDHLEITKGSNSENSKLGESTLSKLKKMDEK